LPSFLFSSSLFLMTPQPPTSTLFPYTTLFRSQFLEILIIACPFIGINVLVARLLMATQKIRVSFYYQIAFNVALALLTIVLIRTFGPVGYTYAYVALYAINFVVLAIFLRQITEFIQYGKLFPYAVMIGIVNLLIMI